MEKILKQCIGIDCAKDELVCCFGQVYDNFEDKVLARTVVPNSLKGFEKLIAWASKLTKGHEVFYVVEATGVYHEKMAHFLFNHGKKISVVLPNKIRFFSKSLDTKTVTDKTSAEAIMLFGLKKNLKPWQKPNVLLMHLRSLMREREQLQQEETSLRNMMHALAHSANSNTASLGRLKSRLKLVRLQISEVEREVKDIIKTDDQVKEQVNRLMSIKGVGLITVASVLGETQGFDLITSKKQLVSYAGLDVVEKTSGTSVRGKSHISHKGNSHIRKALYFPALSAIQHEKKYRDHYHRLISKHGIKMKAAVAIQRKLLELMYTLWKNQTTFDRDYDQNKSGQPSLATPSRLEPVRLKEK